MRYLSVLLVGGIFIMGCGGGGGEQAQEQAPPAEKAAPQKVSFVINGQEVSGDPVRGKTLVTQDLPCLQCHQYQGKGGPPEVAPAYEGVGSRRSPQWMSDNLNDPQSLNPQSIMPSFKDLPAQDKYDIIAFLQTLKEPAATTDGQ